MSNDDSNFTQESPSNEQVMDTMGMSPSEEHSLQKSSEEGQGDAGSVIQKRLGQQAKKYNREISSLQDQIRAMQHQMSQRDQLNQSGAIDPSDPIEATVHKVLMAREHAERAQVEAHQRAHVEDQYRKLNDHLNAASDKYEDFDEVVRGGNAPFTPSMRDALLLVENPGEVAYKLGKNSDELRRISKLHPVDQAREVNKLSFALMSGNSGSSAKPSISPMSPVKANPVNNSPAFTVGDIRQRMKSGNWK